MFWIDGTTINLSVGDTGAVVVELDGRTFSANDTAVFTVKSTSGVTLIRTEHTYSELANNSFTQYFHHNDTKDATPGNYVWDVRVAINGYKNAGSDMIADADHVNTPSASPHQFILLPVVGDI